MDHIYASAIRIAEKVVPDEVDLAPAIIDSALAGGRQWKDLLQPVQGSELGGVFGGIEGGDLVAVINAIQESTSILANLLSMSSAVLSVIVSFLVIRERNELDQKLETLNEGDADKLKIAISSTSQHLVELGIKVERADEMSRLTIQALLEDPQNSKKFLVELSKKQ